MTGGLVVALAVGLSSCSPATDSKPAPGSTLSPRAANAERMERLAACVRDHGVDAVYDRNKGGVYTEERSANGDRAYNECLHSLGLDAPPPPPGRQEFEEMYKFALKTAECLRGLGYKISEAPSFEAWVDAYPTGPWTPYAELPPSMVDDETLRRKCPQSPDDPLGE